MPDCFVRCRWERLCPHRAVTPRHEVLPCRLHLVLMQGLASVIGIYISIGALDGRRFALTHYQRPWASTSVWWSHRTKPRLQGGRSARAGSRLLQATVGARDDGKHLCCACCMTRRYAPTGKYQRCCLKFFLVCMHWGAPSPAGCAGACVEAAAVPAAPAPPSWRPRASTHIHRVDWDNAPAAPALPKPLA